MERSSLSDLNEVGAWTGAEAWSTFDRFDMMEPIEGTAE